MKASMTVSIRESRRYRWLPHLLIALTLVALLAGIGLLRFVESRFVAATGRELTLAAAEISEKLDRMLFERQGDALMMARALSLRTSDPDYLSEYLKLVKAAYGPSYLWLAVTDSRGTVVAATNSSMVGRDYSRTQSLFAARTPHRLRHSHFSARGEGR